MSWNKNKTLRQFVQFSISGVIGFFVDAGLVDLCTQLLAIRPIPAQAIGFSVAVTTTWLINRNFAFSEKACRNWLYEWARYVAANSIGAVANNTVYVFLVLTMSQFSKNPVLAVAAGSLAGLVFNFTLSLLVVFRSGDEARKTAVNDRPIAPYKTLRNPGDACDHE